MAGTAQIGAEDFERVLEWLDPDRTVAGEKYESIRKRLIKIFQARGCHVAEELADETIDRVTMKARVLAQEYHGEPALYFYAVAKRVFLEFTRKPKSEELPESLARTDGGDARRHEYQVCLERCLAKLPADQCALIIQYYEGEKQEKINRRKHLQEKLRISSEALRVKALRIRSALRKCVLRCVRREIC